MSTSARRELSRERAPRSLGAARALSFFVAMLVLPNLLLLVLRSTPGLDILLDSPTFHLLVVSAISLCALLVALAASVASLRSREPVLVLVALGCVSVGVFMLAHGISTPGLGVGDGVNPWFHRFPLVAIAGFALCLAAATRSNSAPIRAIAKRPRAGLMVPALIMAAVASFAIAFPSQEAESAGNHDYGHGGEHDYGNGVDKGDHGYGEESGDGEESDPADHYLSYGYGDRSSTELGVMVVVAAGGALMLLAAARTYWRRWRYGHDSIEFSLLLACLLSIDAIVAVLFGKAGRLSWFDYHVYLLAGFGAAACAVIIGYRRSRGVEGALRSLTLTETVDQVFRGSPEALRVLIGAVEARDLYTEGHSRRVAEMSGRLGVEMGLSSDQVRLLVQGAIIHDIGKIGMPDSVLNKEGPLTRDERKLIEEHPVVGWDIAKRVASLRTALPVIRHHHERYDGLGYPDRLEGEAIPFHARIVAVADVWDALTSERSYRKAWSMEKTVQIMLDGRGTQFDPQCLDAFMSLLRRDVIEAESIPVEVTTTP